MELRRLRAGYAITCVILLCALTTGCIEGKRRAYMLFSNQSPQLEESMEEQECIRCWKELTDRRGPFRDFDLFTRHKATFDLKSVLMTEENILKAISFLSPQMEQELLDCLRGKKLHFSYHGDSSRNSFIKCIKLLLGWPNSHRRYLDSISYRRTKPSLAPAPAAGSPSYDPASSNLAAASSQSLSGPTLRSFQKKLQLKQDMSDSSSPSPSSATRRNSPPSDRTLKRQSPPPHKDVKQDILVAIAATAIATFCFVAMLFFCWCCFRGSGSKIGTGGGKRDERPLLHLNLSNTTSSSFGSNNKEYSSNSGNTASLKRNLSMKFGNHDSSLAEAPSLGCHGDTLPHLKPPPGRAAPPPPRPPPPPPPAAAPRPPPPPKVARAPPAPPTKSKSKPSSLGPNHRNSSEGDDLDSEGARKAKLKPFFWDKVMANSNHSMVWHEISDGSFQFNEEMIESLFGYNAVDDKTNDSKRDGRSVQYIKIIDSRKAQNLSILLRALNVTTDEVLDALQEGNELPVELLQTLLKMAPTSEEELKLRLFAGDISQLGPAERFLKIVVEIPFAFKRIEALIFMSSLKEDVSALKESFATLEVACEKLRNSRLFLKLLEAVLKTGNRMNDGTFRGGAQAFRLDTLLKLSDVKGIDGKTTLLHFVVQEIIRSEGIRAVRTARPNQSLSSVKSDDFIDNSNPAAAEHYRNLGLKVVLGLSTELEDVRKAAIIDGDVLTSTVSKLRQSLTRTKSFLESDLNYLGEESEFYCALSSFVERADSDISWLSEEETKITALVKSTADYFHGKAGRDEGLRLFAIVRDFLIMLDKTCREVRNGREAKPTKASKKEVPPASSTNTQKSDSAIQKMFPAIVRRRANDSSSEDESPSS